MVRKKGFFERFIEKFLWNKILKPILKCFTPYRH